MLKALCEMGWDKPSPVQTQTIPAILNGKDVLARSKNGTGKTGAYVIPCVNAVDKQLNAIQGWLYREFLMDSAYSCSCS